MAANSQKPSQSCMVTPVSRLASTPLAMVANKRLSTLTRLVKSLLTQ